jgi:hypothetical protein
MRYETREVPKLVDNPARKPPRPQLFVDRAGDIGAPNHVSAGRTQPASQVFLIFPHDDCDWHATSKGDLATRSDAILLVLSHCRDVIEVHTNLVSL